MAKTFPVILLILIVITSCLPSKPVPENETGSISTQKIFARSTENIQKTNQSSTIFPSPTSQSTVTLTPTIVIEQHPSSTLVPAITLMPLDTLEPEIVKEMIKTLLREPVDCAAPCFWGIVPGQTTMGEAGNVFGHMGFQMESYTYKLDSGLSISIRVAAQSNIVEKIRIYITPEKQKEGIRREWLAYSPETLINQYGTPSRVGFVADWGPGPFFEMQMYFNKVDLIAEYSGMNIIPKKRGPAEVCPLIVQFDDVMLWMGKNPDHPPGYGVPLEEVTALSLDEFARLMIGNPNKACFIFNGDAYKVER